MPLSKARMQECKRIDRDVKPNLVNVKPNELVGSLCVMSSREEIVKPKYTSTPIASAHMLQHLPNCLDGRYR